MQRESPGENTKENIEVSLQLRLRAALWTALVSGVAITPPVLYFSYRETYSDLFFVVIIFILMPIAAAGISGYLAGGRLIDSEKIHDARDAIGLGLAIGLLAHFILGGLYLLTALVIAIIGHIQAGLASQLLQTIPMLLLMFLMGTISGIWIVGWFTLPVAGIAAYLLSRRYRKKLRIVFPSYEQQD